MRVGRREWGSERGVGWGGERGVGSGSERGVGEGTIGTNTLHSPSIPKFMKQISEVENTRSSRL